MKRAFFLLSMIGSIGANNLRIVSPAVATTESASGPAAPTLADHLARKDDISAKQTELETSYATTKNELKQNKNDVIADIQNKKRENLESSIEQSTADATVKKETGEAAAAGDDDDTAKATEEAGPSESEQAAAAAAKKASKAACGESTDGAATPEELVKAEENKKAILKKQTIDTKEAKVKVAEMESSSVASTAATKEKLVVHAEGLEKAKKVSGGCKGKKEEKAKEQ